VISRAGNAKILLSGGLCHLLPFRTYLSTTFPHNKAVEMFNMGTSCAMGAGYYAGKMNAKTPIDLKDAKNFN